MKTKLKIKVLLAVLLLSGVVNDALAFYNPSTGRWLSRDPIGDEAFLRSHTTSHAVSEQRRLHRESLMPLYAAVSNDLFNNCDYLGLICGITVHRAPIKVRIVWEWPPVDIDAGHEWIEFDGLGFGFWPAGSALYSNGRMHDGDDPYTGNRNGSNWGTGCNPASTRSRATRSTLLAGKGAGKESCCASCDDIKDCIRAVVTQWKTGHYYCLPQQNCTDFVFEAMRICALNKQAQSK